MPSMTTTPKVIIFTDLDGTLLDRDTYSFAPAQSALDVIRKKGIPLVFSSSKTRAEIELYRERAGNDHPFIAENGGAVFVPSRYFSFRFPYDRECDGYLVFELGTLHVKLVETLNVVKKETGISIKGFSDLSKEELFSLCGLSGTEAEFARKREYDEPFIIEGKESHVDVVRRKIEEKGMQYAWGGRFHHILGNNDKGKAVEILKELYENQFFSISTLGIGDSTNDYPMLAAVDHPFLLRDKESSLPKVPSGEPAWVIVDGTGPAVWNKVILNFLECRRNGSGGDDRCG